eukprot:c18411_g1_i1.p1 GENE.c18411_g1_i1~~c18411_g1_i1.p1  ORF type:complete len:269 (-),score=46.77 c18411_g1_i1:54-860(-)
MYWSTYETNSLIVATIHWVPFLSSALYVAISRLPNAVHALPFYFLVWIHGAPSVLEYSVFSGVVPLVNRLLSQLHKLVPFVSKLIPSIDVSDASNPGRIEVAIDLLHRFKLLPEIGVRILKAALANLPTICLTIIVVVVPTFGLGPVLLGLALPVVRSCEALAAVDRLAATHRWLVYWITLELYLQVKTTFDPILDWVPFSQTIHILVLCFLQVPQFRAAEIAHGKIAVHIQTALNFFETLQQSEPGNHRRSSSHSGSEMEQESKKDK